MSESLRARCGVMCFQFLICGDYILLYIDMTRNNIIDVFCYDDMTLALHKQEEVVE